MSAVVYHKGDFPPKNIDWQRLLPLIGPANAAIARYAGLLQGIQNSKVLLSPMTTQEAVLSSRIEGTQATMGEVLEFEAESNIQDESTPKKADIHGVRNYRFALHEATNLLETIPLSSRLIKETHKVLMSGVRGRSKDPGQYRRIPNWIGSEGSTVDNARFVPCGADDLPNAMSSWENYIHSDAPDVLVQLAIVHAEFEAIHPFLDGNGRLGRLIIPLFLFSKGLIAKPNFYISEYLESHRAEYYERLLAISRDGDWTGWCEFFLKALITQAENNQIKATAILELYRIRKDWIMEETRSQYAIRALDWIFEKPIFSAAGFGASSGIPNPTASRILRVCREKGLLRDLIHSSGRKSAVICFPELLNIAEGHNAF